MFTPLFVSPGWPPSGHLAIIIAEKNEETVKYFFSDDTQSPMIGWYRYSVKIEHS